MIKVGHVIKMIKVCWPCSIPRPGLSLDQVLVYFNSYNGPSHIRPSPLPYNRYMYAFSSIQVTYTNTETLQVVIGENTKNSFHFFCAAHDRIVGNCPHQTIYKRIFIL